MYVICPRQCDQIGQFIKVLGSKFPYIKDTNYLEKFWSTFKNITFWVNIAVVTFMGNFCRHLGYFYFQHLVTLVPEKEKHQNVYLSPTSLGSAFVLNQFPTFCKNMSWEIIATIKTFCSNERWETLARNFAKSGDTLSRLGSICKTVFTGQLSPFELWLGHFLILIRFKLAQRWQGEDIKSG